MPLGRLGDIRFEADATNLVFHLVSVRHTRASLLATSNKRFRVGEVFGDDMAAGAMIDRLVHRAEVVALNGKSCRLKDRDLATEAYRT